MSIGYCNTGNNDPSCANNNLVEKYVGTAYDTVKCVSDNIESVIKVANGETSPVLQSPNGTCYCLVVDDAGTLSTCAIS